MNCLVERVNTASRKIQGFVRTPQIFLGTGFTLRSNRKQHCFPLGQIMSSVGRWQLSVSQIFRTRKCADSLSNLFLLVSVIETLMVRINVYNHQCLCLRDPCQLLSRTNFNQNLIDKFCKWYSVYSISFPRDSFSFLTYTFISIIKSIFIFSPNLLHSIFLSS